MQDQKIPASGQVALLYRTKRKRSTIPISNQHPTNDHRHRCNGLGCMLHDDRGGRKEMFKKRQKHFPPASEINKNTPTPLKKKKASLKVGCGDRNGGTRIFRSQTNQSLGVCINRVHGPGPRTTSRNGTICMYSNFFHSRPRALLEWQSCSKRKRPARAHSCSNSDRKRKEL